MIRHCLQIIDQALSPLRSTVLAFKVLCDPDASSLLETYLLWLTNTVGFLRCGGVWGGLVSALLRAQLCPWVFLFPQPLTITTPLHSYPRVSELEIHYFPHFPVGERLRERMT